MEKITIREIDKRYTYAKYAFGCALKGCDRPISHWVTRSNQYYCQSDLCCNFHAQVWHEVKHLIKESN